MTRTTEQSIGAAVIGTCIFLSGFFIPDKPQQERTYTSTIPARLVNQYLMVINGQLDQVTAQDYRELTKIIQPQIYQQYQQYAYQDSIMGAAQKRLKDSVNKKRP